MFVYENQFRKQVQLINLILKVFWGLVREERRNGIGLWLIKYMDLINLVRIGAPIPNYETLVHGKLVYGPIIVRVMINQSNKGFD